MRKVIILSFLTVILAQNKTLELEDVMGGTFRYDRIGSYNWVNNQDAYYFSESDSLGKHFYVYALAKGDTTKAFSISNEQLSSFSHRFSKDQSHLLLSLIHISEPTRPY